MSTVTYRADSPEARRLVTLDDGVTLVFHRPSGLTHVLAPPAPELLATLGEGDADIATLIERLRENFDIGEDDLEAALAARLAELETAGLVWRT